MAWWTMACWTMACWTLLLLLGALDASAAQDQDDVDAVEVFYRQQNITASRGSSVSLSCDAQYVHKLCGSVHVVWYREKVELTDPKKYFTTVNETRLDGTMTRRQVVTEMLHLTPGDGGSFHCKGECTSGEFAVGHYIWISVRG
ncbi:uncharacterized protein V6R79_012911 [Siganus canaliculatus]